MGSALEGALVITVGGKELDALREILSWVRCEATETENYDLVAKVDLFEEAFDGHTD